MGHFLAAFLGMVEAPMLKFICNPSAAADGRDKVCRAPFQTTLLVKSVRFKKQSKNKKIRHATLPTLATQPEGSSKKGSEKDLGRVLGKGSQKGS